MSKPKLDIFVVLNNITKGNLSWIDSLSDDEVKAFQAYVVQLWLRNPDAYPHERTVMMNEISNPYVFSLGKHPKLLYKLFCVAHGFNDGARYSFVRKSATKNNACVRLLMDAYDYTERQAREALILLQENDIVEIAISMGYDPKDIKPLQKEMQG